MRLAEYEARARRPTRPAFSQVRAVEVGFEPTEDLRLHTLSSTAHHRSPASVSVRACASTIRATTGERWRTGVNETKTETRRGLLLPVAASPVDGPDRCRRSRHRPWQRLVQHAIPTRADRLGA